MESNIIPSSKYSIFSFTFKSDLKSVFDTLKNFQITNEICETISVGMASDIKFTNLSHTYEIGAEFTLNWKRVFTLFWRTMENIETDEYAFLRWENYKTEPPTLSYFLSYKLYKDMTNKQTIMIMELEYSIPIPIIKKEQEENNRERYSIYKATEKYILGKEREKTQTESIYIEADMNILSKIIFNLKIFLKIVPIICDEVEYEGSLIEEGTRMVFKWGGQKPTVVFLIVKTVLKEENFCKFVYESCESDPPVPTQEIEWIIKRKGDYCLVRFTHYYKEILNKYSLEHTSRLKKTILKALKYKIEKGNQMLFKNSHKNEL